MKTYQDKNHPLYDGLPFMHMEGDYIPFPCIAEVKLDGEFQYVIKRQNKVTLLNKKEHGRIREDMPVTKLDIPDDTILTAELVYGTGKQFYEFARHKLDEDNNIGVFGCLRWDGVDVWKSQTYLETRQLLEAQKFYNEKICLVPKKVCRDKAELDAFFHQVTGLGYEGIVIIDPYSRFVNGASARRAKRKYVADNDFVILGFQTESKRAKTLSILVGYKKGDKIERLTHVGGGFELPEKEALLSTLKGLVSGRDGEDYLVEPKIVVTVKHYGIIRNPDGSVSSLRHPQFREVRLDKTPNQIDTLK
jgi:ATP-dependent DNA ligase